MIRCSLSIITSVISLPKMHNPNLSRKNGQNWGSCNKTIGLFFKKFKNPKEKLKGKNSDFVDYIENWSFRNKTSKKYHSTVFYVCPKACVLSRLSHVQLVVTLWIIAHQSPLSPISQARVLEWVVMPSNRGSSQPRDQTHISYSSWIADRFFTTVPLRRHQLHFACNQFFLI